MNEKKLWQFADTEADWLRYYGHASTRGTETFDDADFYDRMISIGYAKVNTPLWSRCPMGFITGPKPVLECDIEELEFVSGPRNHENNVYTPLEYFIGTKRNIDELITKIRNAR
jgi:hypothetical protein